MSLSLEDVKLINEVAAKDSNLANRLLARLQGDSKLTAQVTQAEVAVTTNEVVRNGNNKLSQEQSDEIIAARRRGVTRRELSDEYKVAVNTIIYHEDKDKKASLAEGGAGRPCLSKAIQRNIQRGLNAGQTQAAIAAHNGISLASVRRYK